MDRPGSPGGNRGDLEHFGIKGMHWGVRRTKPPATVDAKKVKALKSKARVGGTDALTNKQLKDAVTRMQLEKQYKDLKSTRSKEADKFILDTLAVVGNSALSYLNKK